MDERYFKQCQNYSATCPAGCGNGTWPFCRYVPANVAAGEWRTDLEAAPRDGTQFLARVYNAYLDKHEYFVFVRDDDKWFDGNHVWDDSELVAWAPINPYRPEVTNGSALKEE